MIKAMERMQRPSRSLVAMLGLSLGFLDVGCAGINGFRSVGTERPSWLGLRNSSPAPSASPSTDLYAQRMHEGESQLNAGTKQTEWASSGSPKREAATILDNSPPESIPFTQGPGEKTVRVTLGRPEPLPTRAQPAAATSELASKPSPSPRKIEGTTENAPDPQAILARAEARLHGMNTYQVKISRIERVGRQLQPEEEILLSIQRDPKAVRLEWADGPNKGREVIYSSALDPKMIFVHVANTAISIPTMKIAVDNPMVMRNSRHPITDAGFDTIIDNLRKARTTTTGEQGNRDSLTYKGVETPPGLDAPSHHFVRRTLSGETWNVYLDSTTMLPRLVSADDSTGELVERYIYREIRENPQDLETASAFVPDQRWGESNGLLSRLARAAAGPAQPAASQTTTR